MHAPLPYPVTIGPILNIFAQAMPLTQANKLPCDVILPPSTSAMVRELPAALSHSEATSNRPVLILSRMHTTQRGVCVGTHGIDRAWFGTYVPALQGRAVATNNTEHIFCTSCEQTARMSHRERTGEKA
jgi:hypothetical protein